LQLAFLNGFFFLLNKSIPKGGVCQSNDGSEGICIDLNDCDTFKNNNNSIVDQPSICNHAMNYICCTPKKPRISARSKFLV